MGSGQEKAADRRRGLDRKVIVSAALELADSEGRIPAIRAIASKVGSSPMALYRHVPDKEALVGLLVEEVYAQLDNVDLANAITPQQALKGIGECASRVFAMHPWFPSHAAATPPLGRSGLDFTEHCLAALKQRGCEGKAAAAALGAVMTYATGAAVLAPQAVADDQTDRRVTASHNLDAWPLVREQALSQEQVEDVGLDALIAGLFS